MRKHWTEAVKAENEALKKEVAALRMHPHLVRFAGEVGNNIMLILANTPFEQWPDIAKASFRHAAERQETMAYHYRQGLPK